MPALNAPESSSTRAVERALDESRQVKKTVEEAADELAVVHVVLDKGVSEDARTDDLDRAIEQTDQIEKKLSKSVDLLEKVAEALETESHKKTS
jgi:flagellar biosynthesis/type III secretory pathway ATPase